MMASIDGTASAGDSSSGTGPGPNGSSDDSGGGGGMEREGGRATWKGVGEADKDLYSVLDLAVSASPADIKVL